MDIPSGDDNLFQYHVSTHEFYYTEINLPEHLGYNQLIQQALNVGKWIFVLDSYRIKRTV
jgi:hypothetical protein